jgi:hypothetical protein
VAAADKVYLKHRAVVVAELVVFELEQQHSMNRLPTRSQLVLVVLLAQLVTQHHSLAEHWLPSLRSAVVVDHQETVVPVVEQMATLRRLVVQAQRVKALLAVQATAVVLAAAEAARAQRVEMAQE